MIFTLEFLGLFAVALSLAASPLLINILEHRPDHSLGVSGSITVLHDGQLTLCID